MTEERSANAVDRRLGQRLRARRLEIGLSQERLAELLGITFQQIQKYEKGINRVAASRLYDIAAALDVPVSYFFQGMAVNREHGVAEDGVEDALFAHLAAPDAMQLLTLYNAIRSAKVRRRVLDLVRALAEDDDLEEVDGDAAR